MIRGTTYKQCSCRDAGTKRPLGRTCPRLRRGNGWNPDHGTWYYQLELPPHADGTRRPPLRKGGFATKDDAGTELDAARELLAIAAPDDPGTAIRIADAITAAMRATRTLPDPGRVRKAVGGGQHPAVKPPAVGEWLEEWLAAKKKLRPGTARGYAGHIRLYLTPHLGHIPIDRLRVTDVAAVFDHIAELNDAITEARASRSPARRAAVHGRRLVGPATRQRIRATLRSAISAYMKQHPGVLPANVASLAELPPGGRPKALVWTGERVRGWQKDFDARLAAARAAGGRVNPADIWISTPRPSPVMVWTPAQTMVFLQAARRHRLHALWRLITTRGLRRGEGCGLRRPDTDLAAATATIRWQITQLGWDPVQGAPKSDAGERHRRPRRRHRHRYARLAPRAGQGKGSRRGRLGRQRVRVHRRAGKPAAPRCGHQHVPHARLPGRAAAHPAARPAPRRRDPVAGRRARHESRPGNPRPVVHHHRRRHLHQRAASARPQVRRGRRRPHPPRRPGPGHPCPPPGSGPSAHAPRGGRPVNTMTSSSQPPELDRYL